MAFGDQIGAIQDPDLTQVPGALSTGIGIGWNFHGYYPPKNFNVGPMTPLQWRIGGTTPTAEMLAENFNNKKVKFLQCSAGVAIDGVVATGWLNKTGVALLTGEWVWAVAV
jgi:hypothetical protein